ncbi:MAG: dicarboxylate/amino acid:cation symporter [Chlamydiia bacterium]|nr:dicarboxylate/amino acid:cation symporter [Chlamydiia bacterium]
MNFAFAIAVGLGIAAGMWHQPFVLGTAEMVSQVFINLLKLISLPMISLSILSTASGVESVAEIKRLGRTTVKYTLLTTVIAAITALVLFLVIQPATPGMLGEAVSLGAQKGYLDYLLASVPSNALQPFLDNHVIGVLFIALLFSVAIVTLPIEQKRLLHNLFVALFATVMKVTGWIVAIMPIGIWAFVTLFVRDVHGGLEVQALALYLLCVVAANVVQGAVVLPLLLRSKGIAPLKAFKGMLPALSVAFFTKSSNAALPTAVQCSVENNAVSEKVAGFTFPLCTTINMNGCAAFILTTVLFVATSNGISFTPFDLGMWVVIATIAAVGNAGVPMGCYFLSGALLASMNVPLNILGAILPFYTLIDMLETALNVWSDSCVAAAVDHDLAPASSLAPVT